MTIFILQMKTMRVHEGNSLEVTKIINGTTCSLVSEPLFLISKQYCSLSFNAFIMHNEDVLHTDLLLSLDDPIKI